MWLGRLCPPQRLREFIKAVCIDLVHDRGIPKAAPSSF